MGFIEEIAPIVQKYAPQYGIKVCSPIIAQAIIESASGTSELAVNAHNYFGMKFRGTRCPLAEKSVYVKKGSEQNADGSYARSVMCWYKFKDLDTCVHSYFDFINNPNYSNLKGITDPKKYLEKIKEDEYATSLKYVDKNMAVIKRYNLTQYDPKSSTPTPSSDNSISGYVYQGIDYSLVFNVNFYYSHYADLRQAIGYNPKGLFAHFVLHGMKELRQGNENFNPIAYKHRYRDLYNAFKDDNVMYYRHYIQCGMKENRIAL